MSVNRRFILCIVFIRKIHPLDSLHNSDCVCKMHTDESMDLTVSTFTHFQKLSIHGSVFGIQSE